VGGSNATFDRSSAQIPVVATLAVAAWRLILTTLASHDWNKPGTTRSRVNAFLNTFKKSGAIKHMMPTERSRSTAVAS
jgi:hypothetical protein